MGEQITQTHKDTAVIHMNALSQYIYPNQHSHINI